MIRTETIPASDLEEMLEAEIPCGGILHPTKVPCPTSSAAVLVTTHRCYVEVPQGFKCVGCYTRWMMYASYSTRAVCSFCNQTMPIDGLWRSL